MYFLKFGTLQIIRKHFIYIVDTVTE
jgi:hypothetical protein